jgi:hypothetical protein
MNCKAFRRQLDSYEGERGVIQLLPEMQAHLDSCAACRAHFRIHQQMLAVLESDAVPELPSNFTESIMARLEPVRSRARSRLVWSRLAVYAGYAFLLIVALWFGYKNLDSILAGQRLPGDQQIQKLFDKVSAVESLQSFQRLFSNLYSFIPITRNMIEKTLGKEVLPQAMHLLMILMMTYLVTKAAVFIEDRVRQISRRSS